MQLKQTSNHVERVSSDSFPEFSFKRPLSRSRYPKNKILSQNETQMSRARYEKESDKDKNMSSSRDRKRPSCSGSLQRLRTITNSSTLNKASIIADASTYIEQLKKKVAKLNQELGTTSQMPSMNENELPAVTVEILQKGFLINVFSNKTCPGLLVSILEALENLSLDVLDARVTCTENFQLEAVVERDDPIDAQVLKQAVLQAIQNWRDEQD